MTERVYKNRDNTNDFILTADGASVDLSGVTTMELIFDEQTVSSDENAEVFDWSPGGGRLLLSLGGLEFLQAGTRYAARLIVYDSDNERGIVWGRIPLYVE